MATDSENNKVYIKMPAYLQQKHFLALIIWIVIYLYRYDVGAKATNFDIYGLFCATHSNVYATLRSVLNMCHWHIAPYLILAYRRIIIPLLCSYRGRWYRYINLTYITANITAAAMTICIIANLNTTCASDQPLFFLI